MKRVARAVSLIPTAAAVVVLVACTGSPSGQATDPPSPTETPTTTPTAEPVIDACLVGRWVQDDGMTETWDLEGTVVEATGWTGRVLEFAADGTETVSYDDATPVEAEGPSGPASSTWSGTATYTVATAGDT